MKKILNILNTIEEKMCAVSLAIMLVILSYQVFARMLGKSNSWSEEVARYLFVWLVFMGAAYAVTKHSHIVIETATMIWPGKLRKYISLIGIIVWIIFDVVIVYYGSLYCNTLWIGNRISLGIFINMAIPYAAIPVGYTLTIIRLIQYELVPQIKAIKSGERELSLKEQMEEVANAETGEAASKIVEDQERR